MPAFIPPLPLPTAAPHHIPHLNRRRAPHPPAKRQPKRTLPRNSANPASRTAGNGLPSANGLPRPRIRLMACDMDGTLLNTRVSVSARNVAAVQRLIRDTDVLFVPATGKSRAGALRSMATLGEFLRGKYPAGCPGVFLQGLIVFGIHGEVVYENKCEDRLARAVVQVGELLDLSLIAYSRDSVLCEETDEFVDLLPTYHEPNPEAIGDWEAVIGQRPLNKFIYMAEPSRIDEIRPFVAERIGSMGHLTQAQSNMLEVLPPDSSKGDGVKRLLNSLGVEPENVLAIGDAENDLELLEMVEYSCAVANALPSVKAVSKYTDLSSNDNDGVAEAIDRFIFSGVNVAV